MDKMDNIVTWYGLSETLKNPSLLRKYYFSKQGIGNGRQDVEQETRNGLSSGQLKRMKIAHLSVQEEQERFIAEIKKMLRNEIFVLTYRDKRYPESLKDIDDPPALLYARGDLTLLNQKSFGIVGSRRCTPYGRKMADRFSGALAQRGEVIVSGLAYGVDAAAHQAALAIGGKTIAVLGNGIDHEYPAENAELQHSIAEKGLIISEYPMGQLPKAYQFPERNRIISGLSDRLLVVEAAERSGSLITAQMALEQGKDVFAVPGDTDRTTSAGSNKLIRDGALVALSIEEIME
jgi:DNA processing protein